MLRSQQTTQQNEPHQSAQFPPNQYQRVSPVEFYFKLKASGRSYIGFKLWHIVHNSDENTHLYGSSITKESNSLEQVKSLLHETRIKEYRTIPMASHFLMSLLRGFHWTQKDADATYGEGFNEGICTKYPSGRKNILANRLACINNWPFGRKSYDNTEYGEYGKDDSELIPF